MKTVCDRDEREKARARRLSNQALPEVYGSVPQRG